MYRLPISPRNRVDLTKNISLHRSALPEESPEICSALPPHLDKLLDLPWNPDHSNQIDLWLWYVQQEFETTGGSV
ncbi:hypothetical protein [Chlorogloea sp. CCALA 695]|uniref:hypothetical protein n=1 Tax=Chlorogloea sp. CCALA 695 TaxID=2107693 RepID=UPI0011B23E52|nr:hypothetical protein [Chlorogloea sp. CCALA 695]